jgi:hypothetical protein
MPCVAVRMHQRLGEPISQVSVMHKADGALPTTRAGLARWSIKGTSPSPKYSQWPDTHLPYSFRSSTSHQYQQSIQTRSHHPSPRLSHTPGSADPVRLPSWGTVTATASWDARRISGRGSNVILAESGKRICWNVQWRGGGRFIGSGFMPRYVLGA